MVGIVTGAAAAVGYFLGRAGRTCDPANGPTLKASDAEALTIQTVAGMSTLIAQPGGVDQVGRIADGLDAEGFSRRAAFVRNAFRLLSGQGPQTFEAL